MSVPLPSLVLCIDTEVVHRRGILAAAFNVGILKRDLLGLAVFEETFLNEEVG